LRQDFVHGEALDGAYARAVAAAKRCMSNRTFVLPYADSRGLHGAEQMFRARFMLDVTSVHLPQLIADQKSRTLRSVGALSLARHVGSPGSQRVLQRPSFGTPFLVSSNVHAKKGAL
jgi:hypothetical protein